MVSSAKKPYQRKQMGVSEFYRAPARFLKSSLELESMYEKPYRTGEYGDMHQSPNIPEVPPPVPGPGGVVCLYSPAECTIGIECFAGAEVRIIGGPEEAGAGFLDPEVIKGAIAKWSVDDTGRLMSILADADQQQNVFLISFIDGWGNAWTDEIDMSCDTYPGWAIGVIYDANNVELGLAAGIDSSEFTHILFGYGTHARYLTNVSGLWLEESIKDEGAPIEPDKLASLYVDGSDNIHVLYNSGAFGSVKVTYAENSGGWATTDLETGQTVMYANAGGEVFLDSSGYAHCIYCVKNGGDYSLRHAQDSVGGWNIETIASNALSFIKISAVIKSNDDITIAYSGGGDGDLLTAEGSWGSWSLTDHGEDTDGSETASIVTPGDDVYIFFCDGLNVRQATDAGGGWVLSTLFACSYGPLFVEAKINNAGKIHLSYTVRNGSGPLFYEWYATNESGDWVQTYIAGPDAGHGVVLYNETSSRAEVIYQDFTSAVARTINRGVFE